MTDTNIHSKPLALCLIIGIIQSIAIRLILPHFENGSYPLLEYLATWILFTGLIIIFSYSGKHLLRLIATSSIVGALITAILFSIQLESFTGFLLTVSAIYALMCFHQIYHQQNRFKGIAYSVYFESVWNTICVIISAALFFGLVWLLLSLWQGLFATMGITLFSDIFYHRDFIALTTCLFFSIGLYLSYKSIKIISFLRYCLLRFCMVLLPVLALISILYVASWIFSSDSLTLIQNLESDFSASQNALIYASLYNVTMLLMISLIFVNAIFMDGQEHEKLPRWYKILFNGFIITCLIVSVISIYFVALLSNTLSGAALLQYSAFYVLMMLYFLCYSIAIFQKTPIWLENISRYNVMLGWLLIITVIVLSTPLGNTIKEKHDSNKEEQPNQQKITHDQQTYDNMLKTMDKANLTWINQSNITTNTELLILGYRHDQAIHACRTQINDKYIIGEYADKNCQIANNNQIINPKDFDLLTGTTENIKWESCFTDTNLLFVNQQFEQRQSICRVIYDNRIHVGAGMPKPKSVVITSCEIIWNNTVSEQYQAPQCMLLN